MFLPWLFPRPAGPAGWPGCAVRRPPSSPTPAPTTTHAPNRTSRRHPHYWTASPGSRTWMTTSAGTSSRSLAPPRLAPGTAAGGAATTAADPGRPHRALLGNAWQRGANSSGRTRPEHATEDGGLRAVRTCLCGSQARTKGLHAGSPPDIRYRRGFIRSPRWIARSGRRGPSGGRSEVEAGAYVEVHLTVGPDVGPESGVRPRRSAGVRRPAHSYSPRMSWSIRVFE